MNEFQWEEHRPGAYHVRRRLTPAEETIAGSVRDLRGTTEALERLAAIRSLLPQPAIAMAYEEIGQ